STSFITATRPTCIKMTGNAWSSNGPVDRHGSQRGAVMFIALLAESGRSLTIEAMFVAASVLVLAVLRWLFGTMQGIGTAAMILGGMFLYMDGKKERVKPIQGPIEATVEQPGGKPKWKLKVGNVTPSVLLIVFGFLLVALSLFHKAQ